MNIIAIMGPHGVFYKDEPIKELESALLAELSRVRSREIDVLHEVRDREVHAVERAESREPAPRRH